VRVLTVGTVEGGPPTLWRPLVSRIWDTSHCMVLSKGWTDGEQKI